MKKQKGINQATDTRTPCKNGYVMRRSPGHPLAHKKSHTVLEHRLVLFDKIGEGPHLCAYGCGRTLQWGHNLTTQHLDENKANNHPDNLVAACMSCNLLAYHRPDYALAS